MRERCPSGRSTRRRGRSVAFAAAVLVAVVAEAAPADFEGDATRLIATLRAQGRAYEHGEGVDRDPVLAVDFYCEAARLGDAESQYSLGWIYANGRGVPRDDRLAGLFFDMAAEQGHEYAKKMVAHVGTAAVDLPDCMRKPDPPPAREVAPSRIEADTFVAATPEQKRAADIVRRLAPEFRVNPQFALAIIRAESNFDPNARSPKNAQGLMQLIPETAARFNVKRPYDPVQNVRGGLAYLRWLLAYFRGNVTLVAAAYNAGEGAVEKYRGVPPYAETRAYVQRIRRYYGHDRHPFDPQVADPSPELARIRVVTAR
jgi:hypothetical protein